MRASNPRRFQTRRSEATWLAAVLFGASLISVGTTVAFGGSPSASQRFAIPDPTLVPPQLAQEEATQAARQEAYRNSPAGRDELSLSQHAFRNQSDAQAAATRKTPSTQSMHTVTLTRTPTQAYTSISSRVV